MRQAKRGHRLGLNAEINVVSLIDVILLLLLIFMITAPMMTSGIEMNLPTGEVRPVQSDKAVMVEMNRDRKLYVDGKAWTRSQLQAGFKAYLRGKENVMFRADRGIPHGETFDIMTILMSSGATKLSVIGETEVQGGGAGGGG
jgi:biopolymer transport protein ExbD